MAEERIKRPELDRDHPYRKASKLWSAASTGSFAMGDSSGFIEDGVRSAYQVIDTYLKQGQRVAQQIGQMSYSPFATGGLAIGNQQDLQARSLQITNELLANWFDLIGLYSDQLLNMSSQLNAQRDMDPRGSSTAAPTEDPVAIGYEVTSARPARIYLEFFPGRATLNLVAQDLRSVQTPEQPIKVSIGRHGERLIIAVQIPEEQPPGLHTATLLDASSNAPVGTLCLELD